MTPPRQPATPRAPTATRAQAAAPTPADSGFHVLPHSRRGPLGWRLATGTAIGLLVISGFFQLIVRPISNALADPPPPPQHTAGMDLAGAARLAVAYTSDYWSYDSANPDDRTAALTHWTGAVNAAADISGPGSLRTDIVTAGATATSGADTVIVQTTARVQPGKPGAPRPGDQPDLPYAADPGDLAPTSRPVWLTLDVVITRTKGALHVVDAVLTGDPPSALPRPTTEVDRVVTGTTTQHKLGEELFRAIGEGDLSYLTTTDVQLTGLSRAVELTGVTGWSVAADHADTGTRYATADVTWKLAGTELSLAQPYALSLTDTDGRWLIGALGPRLEE